MALSDAIAWLNTQILTITGVDAATTPKDSIGANGLVSMAYDAGGTLSQDAYSQARDLTTIRVLLIYPRADLANAITALSGKPQAIADKLRADSTFGGNASTFDAINYLFVTIPWQGIECAGYQIDITGVKIRRVVS